MSSGAALITIDQFRTITEPKRCELVRGRLVEMPFPSHRHGVVCAHVAFVLHPCIKEHRAGIFVCNNVGVITTRDPDSVRGPDLFFVSRARWPGDSAWDDWLAFGPDLAIEVHDWTDHWPELIDKAREYLHAGSSEVWLVGPERRQVHVYRPDDEPFILGEQDELTSGVLPDFRCKVAELFEDA